MHVPTKVRTAVVVAVAALLAACGEAPTAAAPQESQGLRPPFDAAAAMGPDFLLAGESQTTITVDPTATKWYQLGAHWVYIPKGAMCRLDSSYGVGEWDKECALETSPVTMTVTVGERNGQPLVVFGKDLRFRPTTDPLAAVYLFMREPSLDLMSYAILWQDAYGAWIDESATDPSVRAFRVNGAWVARRLKHFSGYNVSLGYYQEQSDPTTTLVY